MPFGVDARQTAGGAFVVELFHSIYIPVKNTQWILDSSKSLLLKKKKRKTEH